MSSPKTAAKPARRARAPARPAAKAVAAKAVAAKPVAAKPVAAKPVAAKPVAAKPVAAKPVGVTAMSASDAARRLATGIEQGLAAGRLDTLSPEALQALMAALCRLYSAKVEAGAQDLPLAERAGGIANTDVMIMASALLRSANLAVFELGMWQSWTGR
jgi:hypothetical protein